MNTRVMSLCQISSWVYISTFYNGTDTETCLDIMFDSDINDPYHYILQNIETVIMSYGKWDVKLSFHNTITISTHQ